MTKHVEKCRKMTKNDGPTFFGQLLIRENLGEPWANLFPKSVATLILASKARTLNSKAVWGTNLVLIQKACFSNFI